MNRIRRVLLLLACLFPLIANSPAAAKDDEFEQLYSTPDKFLEVWSDHEINQSRCKSICDRVRKAYLFDSQQENWRNQDLLFRSPLKVRIVESIKSGVLGYAQGPDLFVVQDNYLDDELSEGTLAHELTHIQDNRQLQGGKLPSFLLEGRALTNGHNYRMSIGQGDNQYDRGMAASALRYTPADAQEKLSEFQDSGWDMQAMGTFLVEYMRTKWNGGVPEIHPRLSRMIERIAGGAAFEAAFEQEFATPFEALVQSFMKYLEQSSEHPETRLQGTMWQGISPAGAPSAAEDDDD